MFSNSYMKETKLKNSRKFLWENSNFKPLNVGKNKIYTSLDDLINDYMNRNIFYVLRNNHFLLLNEKLPLNQFFNKSKVMVYNELSKKQFIVPSIDDFKNFRSYKSVELTRYGTLEIRTDCTQKFDEIFKLVAFNVGICRNYEQILQHISKYNGISKQQLMKHAIIGLEKRGYGEECFLKEEK